MKVVFVTSHCPWPQNYGGRFRTHMIWQALLACAEVGFIVLGDDIDAAQRAQLTDHDIPYFPPRQEGIPARVLRILSAVALGQSIPTRRFLWGRRTEEVVATIERMHPDIVILGDTFVGDLIRSLRSVCPRIVINTHNVESVLYRRVSGISRTTLERAGFGLLARNVAMVERRIFPLADAVWAVSDEDATFYRERLGVSRVAVVPNAVAVPDEPGGEPQEDNAIVFTGLYAFPPTEDAALRLIACSRELDQRRVEHVVYLVGREPTSRMFEAAGSNPRIVITGEVPEVTPYIERSAIFAAPIAAGSGTKFKVIQAMAAARPVVTTVFGAEGLHLENDHHAVIAGLDTFADEIARLLDDPTRQRRLGLAGHQWAKQTYSTEVVAKSIAQLLEELM